MVLVRLLTGSLAGLSRSLRRPESRRMRQECKGEACLSTSVPSRDANIEVKRPGKVLKKGNKRFYEGKRIRKVKEKRLSLSRIKKLCYNF